MDIHELSIEMTVYISMQHPAPPITLTLNDGWSQITARLTHLEDGLFGAGPPGNPLRTEWCPRGTLRVAARGGVIACRGRRQGETEGGTVRRTL
jgi:hypothetical protein